MSKPPAPAGLLLLITILYSNGILAATMYLPSLPTIGEQLSAPADVLPITLTAYFLTFAGGQLLFGPLSDRYGRRPLLLGGLMIMVAGSAACALVDSLQALLWARAAQGLGAASAMVIGRAIINDAYDRTQAARATSVISAAMALAPIISPLLGGLIEHYIGWRANFWISGGITLSVMLILALRMPETYTPGLNSGPLLSGILRAYGFLLGSRIFLTFGLLNMAIFAGLHGFSAAAPSVLIGSMDLDPVSFGILMAFGSAGFFIGAVVSSWLGARLGLRRMVDLGVICMLGGALGLAVWVEVFGPSITAIVVLRMIWAIGMGLALPNSVVAAVGVNPATIGAGAALSGFLQTMGGIMGSAVNALFPAGDALSLGLAFACTALFGAMVWWMNRDAAAPTLKAGS
jgi:DHA1 family bicyclomycin/chloramphenicol resistance-like MFS transporter